MSRALAALHRRIIPLTGALVLLTVIIGVSVWINPALHDPRSWSYTGDIWAYFQVAHISVIGAYPAIYTEPIMSTTPGIVVALIPAWWLIHILGLSVSFGIAVFHPTGWLILGPYEVALASCALFAADAVASKLGASRWRRCVICAGEVYALYCVVWWGHPELAVAIAFLLYSCIAASEQDWRKAAWLFGGGLAFQPVILLALPLLLLLAGWRRWPAMLCRLLTPTAVLLVIPLVLDWQVTIHAFLQQATYPRLNRPTPWLRLAPVVSRDGSRILVAGDGPARLLAVGLSLVIGWLAYRRARDLATMIWVAVICLSLWWCFESVVANYYAWPPIACGLICLARAGRGRYVLIVLAGVSASFASNTDPRSEHIWWVVVGALVALSLVARPRSPRAEARTAITRELVTASSPST